MSRAVNLRVAALVYGDGSQPADSQLRSQLDLQTITPSAVLAIPSRPGDAAFASDIDAAFARLPSDVTWIWLLDSTVEIAADTLAQLIQRAEVSPSAALVGAKQLRQLDRSIISSMGVSISQLADPVRLRAAEFDQGQHDGDSDVLAVDLSCSLALRQTLQREVRLMKPAPGLAFGYELGMRLRASGHRVLVETLAQSWVADASDETKFSGQFARLTSRIHLGALTLPALALVGYLLMTPLLVPISVGSALLRKLPAQALAAPAAIVWGWLTIATRLHARSSLRALGDISAQRDFWLTGSELRKLRTVNLSQEADTSESRTRIFESGVAWWFVIPLLSSYQLFAVGVPSSAEFAPLSGSLSELVRTAFSESRPYWEGVTTSAEPSSWLWLAFGVLSAAEPGLALGWFLFFAPAVSFLLFARLLAEFTQRRTLLVLLSLSYALNPILISAVLTANAALATILVLMPFVALATKRVWLQSREQSWSWWAGLGLAGFLLTALYPMLFALLAFALLLAILGRQPSKFSAATLALSPAMLLALVYGIDLVVNNLVRLLPLPTTQILQIAETWWLAPLGLVFVAWGATIRHLATPDLFTILFVTSAAGAWIWISALALPLLAAALVSALISIAARQHKPETEFDSNAPSPLGARLTASVLVLTSSFGVGLLVTQPPQYQQGDSILMPALVSAAAQLDPMVRTLVIEAEAESFAAELIWNDGRHQDEVSQRIELTANQYGDDTKQRVAGLVAGLVAGNSQVATPQLDALVIGYILVSNPSPELTRSLATIDGLASSGQTEFGELWRNTRYQSTAAASVSPSFVQWALLGLLAVLLLLAVPKPRFGRRSAPANPIFDEVTD